VDLNPYKITPIPGEKTITVKSDYLIEIGFRDPETSEVRVDCAGGNAVLMSDLLEQLESGKLAAFVDQAAAPMVMLYKGIVDG